MQRKCIACAEPLPAEWPGYRRFCTGCYFAQRDEKQAATDEAVEQRIKEAADKAYWEGFVEAGGNAFEAGYARGLEAGKRSAPAVALDKEMLRLLLQLAHPDKHAGSAASERATQWLLAVRDNLESSA